MMLKTFSAIFVFVFLATGSALCDEWTVRPDESRLGIIASQQGAEFEAVFERFTAEVVFDVEDLSATQINVSIDLTSFNSENETRDSEISKPEWFDAMAAANATFQVDEVRALEPGMFEATGRLTLKGISKKVVLPFSLDFDEDTVRMQGAATIWRTDFNVGTGQWADESAVGHRVVVEVSLVADR